MTVDEQRERVDRLVAAIFESNGTDEKTHESDCFACDLAAEIAGSIAAYVHFGTRVRVSRNEETDGWQAPATLDHPDAVTGDTRLDMAYRITAHELHKAMNGRRRKP